MIRKIISLVLCLVLVLSMSQSTFAVQKTSDAKIKAIFMKDKNGNFIEVTKKEHDTILQNLQVKQKQDIISTDKYDIKPEGMTDDWYRYDEEETGAIERTDLRDVDSNIQYNGTSSPSTYSFAFSKTAGVEFTVNLSNNEESAVRSGMSISWNSSETYEDTHSFSIEPGKYGWIEVAPVMNYTEGYVRTFDWLGNEKDKQWVRTYIPRDGDMPEYFYYLMESSSKPSGY